MSGLILERPLVAFDLETTGLEIGVDRVVSLAGVRLEAEGRQPAFFNILVNPGIPIPAEATAIHGITTEQVQQQGVGARVAFEHFLEFIEGCDLAGYNCDKFDVPFLEEDMRRVGLELDAGKRSVLDVWKLWNALDPVPTRTLADAAKEFFGVVPEDLHEAMGDARTTAHVLQKMLLHFEDAPDNVKGLEALTVPEDYADRAGKIVLVDGVLTLAIGKHKGKPLSEVPGDYFEWAIDKDFPADTKALFVAELKRRREGSALKW